MPFPANWLEELVVEWLDLVGFASTTKIRVPADQGGAWSPDVAGAKLIPDEGRLLIRHCEVAMYLNQGPERHAKKYKHKFSQKVEQAILDHFVLIFGPSAVQQTRYEKWVICCQVSRPTTLRLQQEVPKIHIRLLDDFVLNEVLPSIEQWRQPPHTKMTTLPADKWLLGLIDLFKHFDLISLARGNRRSRAPRIGAERH